MNQNFFIDKVTMFNFYLYKGIVEVDFKSKVQENNLYLFTFKNGGGKTSLYHAIKWGFYGNAFKYYKDNSEMKPEDMANMYNFEEGFYVEIKFIYENQSYTVRRGCKSPRTRSLTISLATCHGIINGVEAEEELSRMIPRNYGSFFMFDGTDLSSLSNAQDDRNKVDSVLKLLGLDKVKILKDQIMIIRGDLNRELKEVNAHNSRNNEAVRRFQTQSEIEDMCADTINTLSENIKSRNEEIDNYEKNLKDVDDSSSLNEIKLGYELNKANEEGKWEIYCSEIMKNRKNIFIKLLESDINDVLEDTRNKLDLIRISDSGMDATVINTINKILNESLGTCPVCSQRISGELFTRIKEKVKDQMPDEFAIAEECRYLERINALEDALKLNREDSIKYLNLYYVSKDIVSQLNNKIVEVSNEIIRTGSDRAREWQKNINSLKEENRKDETSKEKQMSMKNGARKEKEKAQNEIRNDSTIDTKISRLTKEIERCTSIEKTLEKVIESSISDKRSEILERSSKIFIGMTNKPDIYDHLVYESEDSYSMQIIKKDGRVAPNISTGEKQIVAMSFLLALSQTSGKHTPILMDTPITNLDDIHSKGISNILGKMNNQILLLLQPMERGEELMNNLRTIMAKEYEVEMVDCGSGIIREVTI